MNNIKGEFEKDFIQYEKSYPEPGVKVVPSGQVQLSGFTPAPQGLFSEFRTLFLIFSRKYG